MTNFTTIFLLLPYCIIFFHFILSETTKELTLECPYTSDEIDFFEIDQYETVYLKVGDMVKIPCCQKTPTLTRVWYKNNRFLSENDTLLKDLVSMAMDSFLHLQISEDSIGTYFCKTLYTATFNNTNIYFYVIDVESNDTATQIGHLKDQRLFISKHIACVNRYIERVIEKNDTGLINLSKRGIKIRVQIRWEQWSDCDGCKEERNRTGHCNIYPVIYDQSRMPSYKQLLYKYALSVDCNSYSFINTYVSKYLSHYIRKIPNFISIIKCVSECDANIGVAYVKRQKDVSVLPGTSISLVCPKYNNKKKFQWMYNRVNLIPNDYDTTLKRRVNRYATLYLIDITSEYSGNYTCVYGDKANEHISYLVKISQTQSVRSAAWWRHFIYLLYVALVCFVVIVAGLAINCIQRKNFLRLNKEELLETYDTRRYERQQQII